MEIDEVKVAEATPMMVVRAIALGPGSPRVEEIHAFLQKEVLPMIQKGDHDYQHIVSRLLRKKSLFTMTHLFASAIGPDHQTYFSSDSTYFCKGEYLLCVGNFSTEKERRLYGMVEVLGDLSGLNFETGVGQTGSKAGSLIVHGKIALDGFLRVDRELHVLADVSCEDANLRGTIEVHGHTLIRRELDIDLRNWGERRNNLVLFKGGIEVGGNVVIRG